METDLRHADWCHFDMDCCGCTCRDAYTIYAEGQRETDALDYELELLELREALVGVAHELGGDIDDPRTIVQAAQSARERLNLLMGHWDVPRDADGRSQPFSLVGR